MFWGYQSWKSKEKQRRIHDVDPWRPIIDGVSKRSALIAALLLGILAFTVVAVLQGQGDYLLGVLVAIGFWSLLGLVLMMRWTLSMQFWAGIGSWFRSRRR